MWGFVCLVDYVRVWGGPVAASASARIKPFLLSWGSTGALVGGFGLLARAAP